MINYIKSLLEASEDRVKSPWFGSIIISWMCINWKMLAILAFSKSTIEQKINVVVENHFSILGWFVYPVVAAALFTVFSPLISFGVFQLNHYFKVKQELVKKRSEIEYLESESEINFKRKKLELVAKERFESLDDYSSKRERIKSAE